MSNLPEFYSYGQYSSDNYGVHSMIVDLGMIKFYYSYTTIVAYRDREDGLVVNENQWSTTTGKHLNWIDGGDKKSRISRDLFEQKLQAALERHIK